MAAAAENAPCCMLHSHSLYPQFLELSENAPRCCLLHANPAYLQCPEDGAAAAACHPPPPSPLPPHPTCSARKMAVPLLPAACRSIRTEAW